MKRISQGLQQVIFQLYIKNTHILIIQHKSHNMRQQQEKKSRWGDLINYRNREKEVKNILKSLPYPAVFVGVKNVDKVKLYGSRKYGLKRGCRLRYSPTSSITEPPTVRMKTRVKRERRGRTVAAYFLHRRRHPTEIYKNSTESRVCSMQPTAATKPPLFLFQTVYTHTYNNI